MASCLTLLHRYDKKGKNSNLKLKNRNRMGAKKMLKKSAVKCWLGVDFNILLNNRL